MSSIEQRPVAPNGPSAVKGSPVRDLHHAVFDSLAPGDRSIFGKKKRKKPVVYVGRGSRSYGIIGDWVPTTLVGWMLGYGNMHRVPDGGNNGETGWERL
jgi:hypothetical protein